MLVLSRRTDEAIVIDDQIEVRVLHVSKGRVRLGIRAPRECPVMREEVARLVAREPKVIEIGAGAGVMRSA